MICPKCGTKLKVIDTRPITPYFRIRMYKCSKCGYTDASEETLTVFNNNKAEMTSKRVPV